MRRILIVIVVLGIGIAGAYAVLLRPAASPTVDRSTVTVARGTLVQGIELSGFVTPSEVHFLTFGTAGTVQSIHVANGDRVVANNLIARLDTAALDAQLAAARSALTSARSALAAVEEVLPSPSPGLPAPLPTTEAQHTAALDQARAAVTSAEAAVSAASTAREGAEIRSPITGTITRLRLSVGDRVIPTPLTPDAYPVQVMDLDLLQIEAQASETEVVEIQVDQEATITFDAFSGVSLDGHLCEIDRAGVVVQGVPNYAVTVCLDTTDPRVRVGLTANVDVRTGDVGNVLLVPSRAITLIGDKHTVNLLLADNRTLEVQVTIGRVARGQTEILTGLTEGQLVVLPEE